MIYIFLILAGILKAAKDRLETGRVNIFPKTGTFWNKGTGKMFLGQHFDAWHVCDFLYILSFIFAINVGQIVTSFWLSVLICFAITQLSFNIFYELFK